MWSNTILQPIEKCQMHLLEMRFSAHSNIHSGHIQELLQKFKDSEDIQKSWYSLLNKKMSIQP